MGIYAVFRSRIHLILSICLIGTGSHGLAKEKPCPPWNSLSGIERTSALGAMSAKLTELSGEEEAYKKKCMAGGPVSAPPPKSDLENLGICVTNLTLTPAFNIVHGVELAVQYRSEILLSFKNKVANMSVKSLIIGVLDIPTDLLKGIVDGCVSGLSEGFDQYRCLWPERITQQFCSCVANIGTLSLTSAPKYIKTFAKLSMKANLSKNAMGLLGSLGEVLSKAKSGELSSNLKTWLASKLKQDPKSVEELIAALAKSDSPEMKEVANLLQKAKDAEKATGDSSRDVQAAMSKFATDTYPVQSEINKSTIAALINGKKTFGTQGVAIAHAQDGRWLSQVGEEFLHLPSDKLMGLPTGTNARTKGIFESSLYQIANGKTPKGKTMTHANLDLNGVKTSNDMPTIPDFIDSAGNEVRGVAGGHEFGDSMFRAAGEAIREAEEIGFPLRLDGDEILENAARTIPANATLKEADKILARKYELMNEAIRKKTLPLIEKQVKHMDDVIAKLRKATSASEIDKIEMGTIRGNRSLPFEEYKRDLLAKSYERHYIIRHDVPSLSAAVAVADEGLLREAKAAGRSAKEHLKIYTDQAMAVAKAEYKAANGTDRGVVTTTKLWKNKDKLELDMDVFNQKWIPPRIPVIRFTRAK